MRLELLLCVLISIISYHSEIRTLLNILSIGIFVTIIGLVVIKRARSIISRFFGLIIKSLGQKIRSFLPSDWRQFLEVETFKAVITECVGLIRPVIEGTLKVFCEAIDDAIRYSAALFEAVMQWFQPAHMKEDEEEDKQRSSSYCAASKCPGTDVLQINGANELFSWWRLLQADHTRQSRTQWVDLMRSTHLISSTGKTTR